MAAEPLFIDSGGFYALVSPDSESYKLAVGIMREAARQRRRALRPTTSLMKPPRCFARAASPSCWLNSFASPRKSQALTTEWISPARFSAARKFMLKHLDQEFSFTDCVSFVVMKELRLSDALATDNHFRIASFNPLLAD